MADVGEPLERDDVVVDGLPMVRLRSRALARSGRRWQLLDELLDPGRHGAFVVMLDPRTALAHVIRDRNAARGVGSLVAEARRRGQERAQVYHLHGMLAAAVALVEKNGTSYLDPRDAELVGRIESLPAVAPPPEQEALAGSADESGPPPRAVPLGPAVLDLGGVEAVLWAVRKHGGAPAVIGWGRHGAARIVDFPSQPRAALRRLLVTSADGQVEVVLDRRASRVSGPEPTPERIRQIVASRRRLWVAYLHPLVWRRALFPSGPIVASTFVGWALAAADGQYVRGGVPYFLALAAAGAAHVLYRLVVLPRRERTWHRGNGGPVRIVRPRRGARPY